ncbi:MAG: 1,4-dihydroxy-2-naphthoate octaprenyltransferase [Ekhidna sp.]|nr:1,4-dihydroxy-2-naphthoate octaprenyltransferase [Ekhidna sp.]
MVEVKVWITAFRLRTLPLAFSGWLVGISVAGTTVKIDEWVAGLTLFTALLLQVLSNLANDYGDAVSGVDSDKRKGPNRMVQSGIITKDAMRKGMIICSFLALISGCTLLYLSFGNDFISASVFLLIGLTGIAAAIRYTVGKNPYGYAGFGDFFVFVFFGLVLVAGSYYLQVKVIDWTVLLPSITMGLFSIGVLNVNNVRDIESDKSSGKNSIPVRIGKKKAGIYHAVLLLFGLLSSIVFVCFNFHSWWQLLFLITTKSLLSNIRAVSSKSSDELDSCLRQMVLLTLLFSILFSIGMLTA